MVINKITEWRDCMQEHLTQEKSIYIQISEMIETDICRGILLEEEKVPSTNELAKLYAINPATAAKGINLLVEEGILYKKRGIGMFVSQGALQLLKEKRQDEFFQQYVLPMVQEAKRLSIQPETLRDWIERGFAE